VQSAYRVGEGPWGGGLYTYATTNDESDIYAICDKKTWILQKMGKFDNTVVNGKTSDLRQCGGSR